MSLKLASKENVESTLYRIDAEQAVLGILLNHNETLQNISYLLPEHFYEYRHQKIFSLLSEQIPLNEIVSPVTIRNLIDSDVDFEDIGGSKYLAQLMGMTSGSVGIGTYANLVKDFADKRKMLETLESAIADLSKGKEDKSANHYLDEINQQCLELNKSSSHYKIRSFIDITHENIVDMSLKEEVVSTGLTKIDVSMGGGLKAGQSYCICARPKAGKTMLKATISNHIRKQGIPFLFIACEMGAKSINKRIVGANINRSIKAFQTDKPNGSFAQKVVDLQKNDKGGMYYVDAPRISLKNLESVVHKAIHYYGIKGFVLDYLQLVSGNTKSEFIAQHQENVAQSIAEMCKKEGVWCLYSAQVNRTGDVRNGDGIIMATDWMYELRQVEKINENDPTYAWLDHVATREVEPCNIGSEANPYLRIANTGTHFMEIENDS